MFNLDCINLMELNNIYMELHGHSRLSAKKYGLTVKDCKHLANYAMNKYVAIKLRLIGKNDVAMVYESICENIYNKLSDAAKW